MPLKIVEFQPTPNPDALKCVLAGDERRGGPHADGTLRSYADAAQAEGDPLARAVLAIPGVRRVLIEKGWMTVTRRPGADWDAIRGALGRVLATA